MLPIRSVIQTRKTLNQDDIKVFSTYQDEYATDKLHGNLVYHYGNSAYLDRDPPVNPKQVTSKPFLTPAYRNLTSDYYMNNKMGDNNSNNYRTSSDNVLFRPIRTAPIRTKLDQYFKTKTASIAQQDKASIYAEEYLNKRVNDHFVSNKWLKTETLNLRDTIACLMELSDYMRNKSYDINQRDWFESDSNGLNNLDLSGQIFSQLIAQMESLLLSYNKLNLNAVELKKMVEDFVHAEGLIDRNVWDRTVKPDFERKNYSSTESAIHKDKLVFGQQKELANKRLKEIHNLLNLIENFTHQNLNEIVEEIKCIIMHRLHNKEYQIQYLRDSNGYIRQNPKLPMAFKDWLKLVQKGYLRAIELIARANESNNSVIKLINSVGKNISEQWLSTHKIAQDQVEAGLKAQSKMINTQYDLNQEIDQISESIKDTKLKLGTCQMFNEVYLSQLRTPLAKIDPFFDENRDYEQKRANSIWANSTALRNNLEHTKEYKKLLLDNKQRLDKNLHSSHTGLNYDLRTIVDPRRHAAGTHPSVALVAKSSVY